MLTIRKFHFSDAQEVQQLFYSTVHAINIRDYTQEQINLWAPANGDPKKWTEKALETTFYVVLLDRKIVGFGNISPFGYIDSFYVHHEHQGQGVGARLLARLEKVVAKTASKLTCDASITAKPFFERYGYTVLKKELTDGSGTPFIRYNMVKRLKV